MANKVHIVRLLIAFSFLFISKLSFTQYDEVKFEHITIEDGLPENSVKCILQDHLGFLWFGTQNGLVKYDGYSMTVYRPEYGDTSSISGGNIRALCEDHTGTIWAGTYSRGLSSFDRSTETFTRYMHTLDDTTSLNSNHVNSIYEDNAGRLWIGTDKGLNLWNKQTDNFVHYYFQDSVFSTKVYDFISDLSNSGKTIEAILKGEHSANRSKTFTLKKTTPVLIVMMCEGMNDYGWLENEKGKIIIRYNLEKSFYTGGKNENRIQIVLDTLSAGRYRLRYFSKDSQSYNYWFGDAKSFPNLWGIQVLSIKGEIENIRKILDNKLSVPISGEILSIMENQSTGNLYVGSYYGRLWTFNVKQRDFIKPHFLEDSPLKNKFGWVRVFYQAKDGSIWMGSSRGLARFGPQTEQLNFYQVIPSLKYTRTNDFHSVLEDRNGLIWGSISYSGLVHFDPQSEKFHRYQHDSNNPNSLSIDRILSLYEDHSGILWFGTWGGGLNKWDRRKKKFEFYNHNPNNTNSLSSNYVRSIHMVRDGVLWLGTEGGLDRFERNGDIFKHYSINPPGLQNNVVTSVYQDNTGDLWLGTVKYGLVRFDPVRKNFHYYSYDLEDTTSLSDNHVRCLFEDSNKVLWVGTWGSGLNRFDKTTGRFKRFQHISTDTSSLSDGQVNIVYEDRSGTLWVGTNLGGLNRFDSKTEKFIAYKSLDKDKEFSTITSIYEDKKGNFWVGTDHSGIHLFDRNKYISIDSFNEEDGLANNEVQAILEDDSENLWISTANGLSKFKSYAGTFKNYYASDGLGGNNFSRCSAFKNPDGEMFFGSHNGFVVFHPDSISDDPIPPKIVLSKVSLFNRPGEELTFDGFISELDEIKLSHDQNDLRFEFVGLHYGESGKNKYSYILENFDADWVVAGTQRNATYTNLDPGEYIFRVMAANRDGIWNEEEANLIIIVTPPWWATWWAYILYTLVTLSVFIGSTSFYLNRQRLKHELSLEQEHAEKLAEVDQMKSHFFANISHEFRTPLTLIKGPAKQIIDQAKDQKFKDNANLIHRGAEKLSRLVGQLLDLSKIEAGQMSLSAAQLNVITLLKETILSFAPLAERKNITLKFNPTEEQILVYLDRNKVEKIINNILSNAFKFTPEFGQITAEVSKDEKMVVIKISDTGIGIPKDRIDKIFDRFYQIDSSQTRDQEGTGIGLSLTKELVELHKGEIKVESEEGDGTTVTIRLPLGKEHLKSDEICELEDEEYVEKEIVLFEETISESVLNDEKIDIGLLTETAKPLLLIVEDNKDVRNYIGGFLDKEYRMLEAADGEDGLEQALNHIPDLIISDIMMPKMDGFELCNKLKTDERTSHIPVILLTAKATSKDKIEGYETGVDDYIMKPFDAKELQVRINNLIRQRKKLREHFLQEGIFNLDNKNITSVDKKFLEKSVIIIYEHLSDSSFGVESFASEIALSRVTLHKKLVALIGEPPGELIKRIRLSKAAKLIENKTGNISEIALEVGFNNPAYFSECFRKQFGVTPSQYQHNFTNP